MVSPDKHCSNSRPAGAFRQDVANRLFADSPFQSEQLGPRSNKVWMVSHPVAVEESRVQLLLESWDGESTYFWQRNPELQELLKGLGMPRVLEIAMRSGIPDTPFPLLRR